MDIFVPNSSDQSSLSPQAMMELLVAHIPNGFVDANGNFLDVTEWSGVTSDYDGAITEIHWTSPAALGVSLDSEASGFLDMRWIPPTVQNLHLEGITLQNFHLQHLPHAGHRIFLIGSAGTKIDGAFIARDLPPDIETIDFSHNALFGSVEAADLPRTLTGINLTENSIQGSLDCTRFPPSLEHFILLKNRCTGSLDLTHLPEPLAQLNLSENQFQGEIHLQKLPKGLHDLNLSSNALAGSLSLIALPHALEYANFSKNQFSGEAALTRLPKSLLALHLHSNALEGSILLDRIPPGLSILSLHDNGFGGSIVLHASATAGEVAAAAGLTISIHHNQLRGAIQYTGNEIATLFVVENWFTSIDWETMQHVRSLNASANALSGSLDLAKVPTAVRTLCLSKNAYSSSIALEKIHEKMCALDLSFNKLAGSINLLDLPKCLETLRIDNNALTGRIQFGCHTPKYVSLNDNQFSAIASGGNWENLVELGLQNNGIAQEVVVLGRIGVKNMKVNLCGNRIGRCVMVDGSQAVGRSVMY